jgi:CRISPR/Cas system Type II protein with McrA/HNH and RuvC-like nuclease domain
MTGDLSVKLGNGKKLEAPASNEVVESIGVTVAKVNDKFQIEEVIQNTAKLCLTRATNKSCNNALLYFSSRLSTMPTSS